MKKLILSLALCAVMPAVSFAEDNCPGMEQKFETTVNELQLTDEQKTKLKALHEKHKADMDKEHDAMKALREKHLAEVKALLGDEKFKKFEESMHSHKKGHGMSDHSEHMKKGM